MQLHPDDEKVTVDAQGHVGQTSMWWVAGNGYFLYVMRLLLDKGADVDVQTPCQWSMNGDHHNFSAALFWPRPDSQRHLQTVQLLLECGAGLHKECGPVGHPLLQDHVGLDALAHSNGTKRKPEGITAAIERRRH